MSRRLTVGSALLAFLVTMACLGLEDCDNKNDPTKPTGSLGLSCSVSPENGRAPLVVRFSAAPGGLNDKEKEGVRYTWSFGDGTTAGVSTGTKQFNSGGSYNVKLTAIAPNGDQGVCQKTIQVESDLRIDSCTADPSGGKAPLAVQFRGQAVGDGQHAINYAWDFGDGGTGSGPEPAHTYSGIGNYTARMTASSQGASAQCTIPIGAFDSLTVNCSASATSGDTPVSVSFDADVPGESGCSYSWDFDDGFQSSQKAVTHRYDARGRYYATVTATCGTRRGSCRQTIDSIKALPSPHPTEFQPASNGAEAGGSGSGSPGGGTRTPTPGGSTTTPSVACGGPYTFVGTGTPVTAVWFDSTRVPGEIQLAPVDVDGLPPNCKVHDVRYWISLTSDVDLSTMIDPFIQVWVRRRITATNAMIIASLMDFGNAPATFSGTQVGSSCNDLIFQTNTTAMQTATPPYDGTWSPYSHPVLNRPTSELNGQSVHLYVWGNHRTGNVTINCWRMEIALEPDL